MSRPRPQRGGNLPVAGDAMAFNSMIGPRDVPNILQKFDPDLVDCLDAEEWLEEVEAARIMYGWDARRSVLYASMQLRGPAKTWYNGAKAQLIDWDTFKAEMKLNFPTITDATKIHNKLKNRRKGRDETVSAYFHSVLSLARKIKLDEDTIKRYVINGLPTEARRTALLAQNFPSLSALLKAIQETEAAEMEFVKRRDDYRRGGRVERDRRPEIRDRRGGSNRYQPYQRYAAEGRDGRGYRDRWEDRGQRDRRDDRGQRDRRDKNGRRSPRRDVKEERNGDRKRSTKERICYRCRQPGHIVANCPKPEDFRVGVVQRATPANKNSLTKMGVVQGKTVEMFVDLGSDCSLMKKSVAKRLNLNWEKKALRIVGYGGQISEAEGIVKELVEIDGVKREIKILIVPDDLQKCEVLIGRDFFNDPHIIALKTIREFIITDTQPQLGNSVQMGDEVGDEAKDKLINLIENYRLCFAENLSELGHTTIVDMRIELKENKVVRYAPYRIPYAYKEEVKAKIEELKNHGVIEESTSEFASPMVIIRKKNGSLRVCVDYRKVNSIIKKEHFPMPLIEEELNGLGGKKYFSSLDLYMGYHQISVEKESRPITAFTTPDGLYQYTRVPFGLCNSPAVFMRMISKVLQPIDRKHITFFMDDILVSTKDLDTHFEVLEVLFRQIELHHLTFNIAKCQFLMTKISFLGHEVSADGVSPGSLKTKAIEDFPRPTNVGEVKKFLGLTGYFRKFVPQFALLAAPLNKMKGKDVDFKWGEEEEKSFMTLKDKLSEGPCLALFASEKKHEVHCDASKKGLGGILLQQETDGKWHPVAYYSRGTTTLEARYHSYELELLAIVESLRRFRYYLLGRHFKILTDCRSVQMSHNTKHLIPRIARWWLHILEYDFEMEHRRESQMQHVDCLSRMPSEKPEEYEVPQVLKVSMPEDWIASLQLQDSTIKEIAEILGEEKKDHPNYKDLRNKFQMVGQRVYAQTAQGLRFYVPRAMRYHVMSSAHYGLTHAGANRTIEYLQREYWFPKLARAVKKFVSFCIPCAIHKAGADENRHQIHVVKKVPIPFHTIHVDFAGPFPRAGGKQHVFAIVDAFTRFTVLRAVTSTTARNATKVIKEVAQYFGMPNIVVSDNGSAFKSAEFQKFCRENVITHSAVAVSTPRANGLVERIFRTMRDSLQAASEDDDGRDWNRKLERVQWMINTSINRTTGETPQKLLLGYSPRSTMGDQLWNALQLELQDSKLETIEEIRDKAARRMEEAQRKQAEEYNRKHKSPRVYQKGEIVLLRHHAPAMGSSRKMLPRFRGPYIIQEVLYADRYVVADTPVTQITQKRFSGVFHADKLKPWVSKEDLDELAKVVEVGSDEDMSE